MEESTDFGFEKIPKKEKAPRVAQVFKSVANRYDLMNDLMSFGLHRLWKRIAINHCALQPGFKVLDVAGGTGDLALQMASLVGNTGQVISSDIQPDMLSLGRDKLLDHGVCQNVAFVQANAESLPFQSDYFDVVTIGFGLRNVTHQPNALQSIYRILKPGGKLIILEFSTLKNEKLAPLYDWYSFEVLPRLGKLVTNDSASYQYLAESIRKHPDQETLKALILKAGFSNCDIHNLMNGVVAIHVCLK